MSKKIAPLRKGAWKINLKKDYKMGAHKNNTTNTWSPQLLKKYEWKIAPQKWHRIKIDPKQKVSLKKIYCK